MGLILNMLYKIKNSVVPLILIVASCATPLSGELRLQLDNDAERAIRNIKSLIQEMKSPLNEFYAAKGDWPNTDSEKTLFYYNVKPLLQQYDFKNINVLKVDDEEVLIEFFLTRAQESDLPLLMNSWIVIFGKTDTNTNNSALQVVSLIPVLPTPEELSIGSDFSVTELRKLLGGFKQSLKQGLTKYSLTIDTPSANRTAI